MGNQLPNRCVVPCNPVCCAMCMHPAGGMTGFDDAAEGGGAGGKSANIFANAASALSLSAEEIPTDERLEKDMASEMAELWRVEASGAAVVQRLAQRGASSTLVEGLLRLQRCGDDEDDDDGRRGGSLSPPLRTQVSLHDRAGDASGSREPSFARCGEVREARPCEQERQGREWVPAEAVERIAFLPPARPRAGSARRPPDASEADGQARPQEPVPSSASGDSRKAPAEDPGEAVEAPGEDMEESDMAEVAEEADGEGRAHADEAAALRVEDGPPPAPLHSAGAGLPEGVIFGVGLGSAVNSIGAQARVPSHSWYAGNRVERAIPSMTSSEESSFAGFIEDPLEKNSSGNVHIWLGARPCGDQHMSIAILNANGDIEEVKPDRSSF